MNCLDIKQVLPRSTQEKCMGTSKENLYNEAEDYRFKWHCPAKISKVHLPFHATLPNANKPTDNQDS